MKTSDICFAAVNQNGSVLVYVPNAMRTKENCFAAVDQNGF